MNEHEEPDPDLRIRTQLVAQLNRHTPADRKFRPPRGGNYLTNYTPVDFFHRVIRVLKAWSSTTAAATGIEYAFWFSVVLEFHGAATAFAERAATAVAERTASVVGATTGPAEYVAAAAYAGPQYVSTADSVAAAAAAAVRR
jgi:hypothetical protein